MALIREHQVGIYISHRNSPDCYSTHINFRLCPIHPSCNTSDSTRRRLGLKSAYAGLSEDEVPLTGYIPSFPGVINYVLYSVANLVVTKVLGEVEKAIW